MRDDLRSDDAPELARRNPDPTRAATDREVPLPRTKVIAEQVHAWLDGEGTESAARRSGGAHDVDFWKRLDGELARRRRTHVPEGFEARIMDALR